MTVKRVAWWLLAVAFVVWFTVATYRATEACEAEGGMFFKGQCYED